VRAIARTLLVMVGLAAIAYLVAITGLDALLAPFRTLSWRVVVVALVPYAVVAWLHTLAWRLVFPHEISLARLFAVRLAGEALNEATVSVGGEPVKAYLLHGSAPLVDVSASLMVEKTAITAAQVVFLAVALAVALPAPAVPPDFLWTMTGLLAIQVAAVGGFVLVQCAGLLGRALRLLQRLGLPGAGPGAQGLRRFDGVLAAFYRARPGRVVNAVLIHAAGWVVGSIEVYLVLRWLQVEASLADALVIDAFATAIRFMAFVVPGGLGVLEGGFMLAFGALGLDSGLGLSFALIRRLRLLVWSALGLVALGVLRSPASTSSTATRRG
jgi:uncharacterized membrane protein YbhN (UPF0104 family)